MFLLLLTQFFFTCFLNTIFALELNSFWYFSCSWSAHDAFQFFLTWLLFQIRNNMTNLRNKNCKISRKRDWLVATTVYTRSSIATTAELRVKGTGSIPPPKIISQSNRSISKWLTISQSNSNSLTMFRPQCLTWRIL